MILLEFRRNIPGFPLQYFDGVNLFWASHLSNLQNLPGRQEQYYHNLASFLSVLTHCVGISDVSLHQVKRID